MNKKTAKKKRKTTTLTFTVSVTAFRHDLGITLRDVITGFQGVVTGRVQYLTGCTQYLIQPKGLVAGKAQESHWIDEGKLRKVRGAARVSLQEAPNGGPQLNEAPKH